MVLDEVDCQILEAIATLAAKGYQPTYRDVAAHVGMAVSAVHRHVRSLREGGLVHAEDAIARSISVTADGRVALEHANARA